MEKLVFFSELTEKAKESAINNHFIDLYNEFLFWNEKPMIGVERSFAINGFDFYLNFQSYYNFLKLGQFVAFSSVWGHYGSEKTKEMQNVISWIGDDQNGFDFLVDGFHIFYEPESEKISYRLKTNPLLTENDRERYAKVFLTAIENEFISQKATKEMNKQKLNKLFAKNHFVMEDIELFFEEKLKKNVEFEKELKDNIQKALEKMAKLKKNKIIRKDLIRFLSITPKLRFSEDGEFDRTFF